MKNPVNIEVYGVLVLFEALKVLEGGILLSNSTIMHILETVLCLVFKPLIFSLI